VLPLARNCKITGLRRHVTAVYLAMSRPDMTQASRDFFLVQVTEEVVRVD
jgi:hypothetical protein